MRKLTKKEAVKMFRDEILPSIRERCEKDGRVDRLARREAWNNFTDSLCKDGQITSRQYNTWNSPF